MLPAISALTSGWPGGVTENAHGRPSGKGKRLSGSRAVWGHIPALAHTRAEAFLLLFPRL